MNRRFLNPGASQFVGNRQAIDRAFRSKLNDRKAREAFGLVQLRLAVQSAHVAIRADEAGWIEDPTVDQHLELGELA